MPVYQYFAKKPDGSDVSGTKEAPSVGVLVSELRQSGLVVLNVEEPKVDKKKGGHSPTDMAGMPAAQPAQTGRTMATKRKPVKTRDLAIFCRQLSTMLKAGLPIIDALETMANEQENLNFQEVLYEMRDDIESGTTIAEAVNKHPKIFSLMFRAMIEAGEASGSLTKIVAQLGEYMKKADSINRKIKSATMYPKFVVIFFSLIIAGVLLFLVPQFEETFKSMSKPCPRCTPENWPKAEDDEEMIKGPGYMKVQGTGSTGANPDVLWTWDEWQTIQNTNGNKGAQCPECKGSGETAPMPAITNILLELSRFVKRNILFVLAGIVLLIILWKQYSGSETGRQQLDRLILHVPVAGNMVLKTAIARYCTTLSTLLHNGVSLDQGLDIVSRVAGNCVVEEATQHVRELVITGQGLSESMGRFPIFPPLVTKMVSVGEESGALAEMLTDIGDYYEEEVERTVEGLSSIIEPLMIVMIGSVVAVVVLAIYLPIFMMGGSAKKSFSA